MLTDRNGGTCRPKIFINRTTVRFLIVITMNYSHELAPEDPWEATRKALNSSVVNVIRNSTWSHSLNTGIFVSTETAVLSDNLTTQIFYNGSGYMNDTHGPWCTQNVSCVAFNSTANSYESKNWYYLILLVFVFTGVLGNTLVCVSICLEKKLQNMTNYFLMSLAVADLLVSMVVMPFGISSGLYRRQWPFGTAFCNVYVTFDVLCCSASIIHMTVISVGRYMGIRNPLKTRNRDMRKNVALCKILLVWLFSMLITSPITILGILDNSAIQPDEFTCSINNAYYWIYGSLAAFYIPMVIMVITFLLTVKLLRNQAKFGIDGYQRSRLVVRKTKLTSLLRYDTQIQLTDNAKTKRDAEVHTVPVESEQRNTQLNRARGKSMKLFQRPGMRKDSFNSTSNTFGHNVAYEQKATKVLGVVFFSFVGLWAPFFVLNILFPFVSPDSIQPTVVDICLWLGYISSTINPIIYTIFNKKFRHAFVRLLLCSYQRYSYRYRKSPATFAGRNKTIVDRLSRTSVRQPNKTPPISMRSTMNSLMMDTTSSSTYATSRSKRESSC